MKVESVQLLLSLLHLAGGIQESSRRGENNQWEEKLPILSQREFDRERLGIQFPFMKVGLKTSVKNMPFYIYAQLYLIYS